MTQCSENILKIQSVYVEIRQIIDEREDQIIKDME